MQATQQNQPKKPNQLPLTPEELAKVLERKERAEKSKVQVNSEEFIVAEMGYYFGWGGVEAILYNRIELSDAMTLIRGARKVWNGKLLDIASVVYTASAAAQSGKRAGQVLKKGLKNIIREARIDI